jgi:predicted ATP-grasp superfamily ATP-dependent carboligase
VTYGRHSKTLSVVRSLGVSGRKVLVSDSMRAPLSAYSKYCSRFIMTPSPKERPDEFMTVLRETVKEHSIDLVIPMDDWECDLLSVGAMRATVGCEVSLPDEKAYEVARDKFMTAEFARKAGLRVPRTALLTGDDEVQRAAEDIGFPLVVKPVRSSGSRGFAIAENSEALNRVPRLISQYGPMAIQEFIPSGGSVGVACLLKSGYARAVFTHRRILEFPESGGPSIIRESIRHEEAERDGMRLLEALRWHGVAMAEFRIDARDSKPVLMEINPRFWGSLPLAIASGVDFPRLLCDMYEHGDVPKAPAYATNVRCVNVLPLGVTSVMARHGISRARMIARHALADRCFDVESLSDPWPALGAVISMFGYVGDKAKLESFFGSVQSTAAKRG